MDIDYSPMSKRTGLFVFLLLGIVPTTGTQEKDTSRWLATRPCSPTVGKEIPPFT
jgi:hypothetical protein